ncbi:MAG: Na(+)-translocating NADH-quinone reductase subunit A [Oceanospirillaceae bacterium]|nr:Na(+)-translocating NADH-quinone reductase subunit A [Oceanospirillaceae bacterium]
MIKINKGLDLPILGTVAQSITASRQVRSVAVSGPDYVGCKPTMAVKVGDRVKLGQVIFSDKKIEGVHFTAPAGGTVIEINRGERRALLSVVIEVDEKEEAVTFDKFESNQLASLTAEQISKQLQDSGLWSALRTRPFSKIPAAGSSAAAIFVTAIDTNPLAADPAIIIAENSADFSNGLTLLTKLTTGKVFLCKAPNADIPTVDGVTVEEFAGVHPAGNAGTHIHFLEPVSRKHMVWTIGYQDVVALGKLFTQGVLSVERIISIAGPVITESKLLRTRVGAKISDLLQDIVDTTGNRVITGSVWNGRTAAGALDYLGRYSNQVTVLKQGDQRELLGWAVPGANQFSVLNVFTSALNSAKKFSFSTSTNGSERAMLPVGQFERLMPMDILPTQLLRAIVTGDIVSAMELGALELDEEDLALCTFACPGKYEYGPILRDNLTRIEREA